MRRGGTGVKRWKVALFVALFTVWVLLLFGAGVVIGRAVLPGEPPGPEPTRQPEPGVVWSVVWSVAGHGHGGR
jgi:hypothetical protein